jgi:hypothetical protein
MRLRMNQGGWMYLGHNLTSLNLQKNRRDCKSAQGKDFTVRVWELRPGEIPKTPGAFR